MSEKRNKQQAINIAIAFASFEDHSLDLETPVQIKEYDEEIKINLDCEYDNLTHNISFSYDVIIGADYIMTNYECGYYDGEILFNKFCGHFDKTKKRTIYKLENNQLNRNVQEYRHYGQTNKGKDHNISSSSNDSFRVFQDFNLLSQDIVKLNSNKKLVKK